MSLTASCLQDRIYSDTALQILRNIYAAKQIHEGLVELDVVVRSVGHTMYENTSIDDLTAALQHQRNFLLSEVKALLMSNGSLANNK